MVPEHLEQASALLKTLGNGHRLHILTLLLERERRVGELEQLIELSQSALSQHLARLRRDGLVKTRRQAQTIYYSLVSEESAIILDVLKGLFPAATTHSHPTLPQHRLS